MLTVSDLSEDQAAVLRTAVARVVAACSPERVVLFGSWARGDAGPDSDLDLLVVLPEVDDAREEAVALRRALADLPVPKDVFVTSAREAGLRARSWWHVVGRAAQEGRVVYEREGDGSVAA